MKTQFIRHLRRRHGIGKILLIGKDEKNGIAQFIFIEHSVHFITCGIDTVGIVGVDYEDESLGILVVVSPEGTDLVLTTDIPYGEGDVLVFDGFDIETNCGDGGHN